MPEMWDVLDQHGNKTGRQHERGQPMPPNDYMLIVHVWKINTRGEWLVDQRAPRGNALDYKWETTGGCAISGDTSLAAAIRETREELGITLHPDNGRFYRRVSYHNSGNLDNNGDRLQSFFVDVWVFACDCDVSDLTFQKEETLQALWATQNSNLKKRIYLLYPAIA